MIEGTPSLWKKFVWPYHDRREECSVKVCGQHIKVLAFPNYNRTPSTMVAMLQYCSNVQHLSLPSTVLDHEQLRKAIHHMANLQILEVEVDSWKIKKLLINTSHLRELIMYNYACIFFNGVQCEEILVQWKETECRPLNINLFVPAEFGFSDDIDTILARLHISSDTPISTVANFKVYAGLKVPLNLSPSLPRYQMQVERSGKLRQVTTSYVKLSDFGILGLEDDIVVMTDCQYGRKTMNSVRYSKGITEQLKIPGSVNIRLNNLSCVTHVNFSRFRSFYSGHLEQLANACPNLQRLNLQYCDHCLDNLQGLQAIASHCHSLQGLNLLGIHVLKDEDCIALWETLKLTHVAVQLCTNTVRSKVTNR